MLGLFYRAIEFNPGDIPAGTIIDESFRVLGFLDKGGMGSVYFVEDIHRTSEKKQLLKILSTSHGHTKKQQQTLRQRFRAECETLHSLQHPAIPHIFYNGSHENIPFLVMEHAKGETFGLSFDKLLQKGGWQAVFKMAGQVADALDVVHAAGIIHRDIKPNNIIVDPETGNAVVLDFGVARLTTSNLTGRKMRIGTPGFTAPEQLFGNPCPASDQWSFAACFYALLTNFHPGRRPEDKANLNSDQFVPVLTERVASNEVIPLEEVEKRFEVPPGVVAAITKAMSYEPEERYENVTAFVKAMTDGAIDVVTPNIWEGKTSPPLKEWLGNDVSSTESISSPPSRRPYLWTTLVASAALATATYFIWPSKEPRANKVVEAEVPTAAKVVPSLSAPKSAKEITKTPNLENFEVTFRAVDKYALAVTRLG